MVKGRDDPLHSSPSNGKICSEEASLFFAGMGDFRLFRTQREFEALTEECCEFLFHLLGQVSWSRDTDEPIICISDVFDADEGRVVDHHRWNASDLLYQFPKRFCTCCSFLDETRFLGRQFAVEWIGMFLFSTSLVACLYFLHFFVKFVQVDIG